jgi:uncharacterized LabA/DUF88 family protein
VPKRTAVLLDGGFVGHNLYRHLGGTFPTAEDVYEFAQRCLDDAEELFRIYYYDCSPYEKSQTNPVSGERIDFGRTDRARRGRGLSDAITLKPYVAYRRGELSFDGWALTTRATKALIRTPRSVEATDLKPVLRQKRVDMMIGLDVAWLASKRIVDRIVLATGDSDFVPAMKFARREGVQVVLVTMGHRRIKRDLLEHADLVRDVIGGVPPE